MDNPSRRRGRGASRRGRGADSGPAGGSAVVSLLAAVLGALGVLWLSAVVVPKGLLAFALAALLPFSVVPPEVYPGLLNLNYLLLAMVLIVGARYDVLHGSFDLLERSVLALAFILVVVLLVRSGGSGRRVLSITRELSKLFAGVVLYRLARVPYARPVLRLGLMAALWERFFWPSCSWLKALRC